MMELLSAIEGSAFSIWVRESTSILAYPTILTLHTVGLAVLVGASAAVDLRFLGFGRQIELESMERFFPAMWIGFWINAISGVMLWATDPITKGTTLLFMAKLAIIAVGVVLIVLLRREVYGRARAAMVTRAAKVFAALSLLAWIAAIVTGRLMAYLI
jgi:hypothetical protein